jgi:hypothetical protein
MAVWRNTDKLMFRTGYGTSAKDPGNSRTIEHRRGCRIAGPDEQVEGPRRGRRADGAGCGDLKDFSSGDLEGLGAQQVLLGVGRRTRPG